MSEAEYAQPGQAPDVSVLVRDPQLVVQLTADQARDLLPQIATLAASLAVRAGQAPAGRGPELLNNEQVLALFGLPPAWLQQHRRELEQAGVVVKASHKLVLYKVTRLRTWLAARQVTPQD